MDRKMMRFKIISIMWFIVVIVVIVLPYIKTIKIYNPIAGVYFEVHGSYAVAVDYTKEKVKIPSHCLLRPVTKTSTIEKKQNLKGCYCLEEVYIPDTVIEISEEAFLSYDKLKKVTGGKYVKKIGVMAFHNDKFLGEIPYFEHVEEIDDFAFSFCNISRIKLPGSLQTIGDCAFQYNNISVLETDLSNVKTGYHCFFENPFEKSLGGFIINARGELQTYYEDKTIVVVPDEVTAIYGSFYEYGNMGEEVKIYLPNTVKRITATSFWFKGHGTVYVPDSVEKIDYYDEKYQLAFVNATIVTTPGSCAEEFAKKYNIDYEIVDEIEIPENREE